MGIQSDAPECDARQGQPVAEHTQPDQHRAGDQEQPARTVHQEEAQRPPAVTKCSEMRRVRGAPVGVERHRQLGDVRPV